MFANARTARIIDVRFLPLSANGFLTVSSRNFVINQKIIFDTAPYKRTDGSMLPRSQIIASPRTFSTAPIKEKNHTGARTKVCHL